MKLVRAADLPEMPAAHENPLSPGVLKKVLLRKDDLQPGRLQMINWSKLPVGRGFAAHYHEDMQEVFVILRGRAELEVDGQCVCLGPGDAVRIDAREVHRMHNVGDEETQFLALGVAAGQNGKTVLVAPQEG